MRIIFYGRHQIGMVVLLDLLLNGHKVKVLTPEDDFIADVVDRYHLETVTLEDLGQFDLFICCHGSKIIPAKYLVPTKFVNFHPCIDRYKGKDPISRYIEQKDMHGSVTSHFMVEKVDAGEEIVTHHFVTPVICSREDFYMRALPFYLSVLHDTLDQFIILEKTYE